jgi:hypothetical protein
MKDAKGHGSDTKGTHAEMINNLPGKMNRAHFEVIANMLKSEKPADDAPTAEHTAFQTKLSAYADKLATTNPGFNRQRFIEAAVGKVNPRSRQSSRDNASRQIMRAGSRGSR